MKRFLVVLGVLAIVGFLMVISEGCGKSEQALSPAEHQEPTISETSAGESRDIMDEGSILIVIRGTGEKKEISDPWISDAVLSILPEETRIRLFAEGSVLIEDAEIASITVVFAGMEIVDVSDGILLVSWGCAKCCYADPPCCSPCPACCDKKDKDQGVVPFNEY